MRHVGHLPRINTFPISCVVLITKWKFTTNAQNVPNLKQYTQGHFWTWTVALFKGSGTTVNGLTCIKMHCRSQWPRGLRRRSTAARLLRSWVWIPPGELMSVCCECCVLSGRDLCDERITRPEESYRLWCVAVCDIETSSTRSQTSINSDWTYEISSLEGTSSR